MTPRDLFLVDKYRDHILVDADSNLRFTAKGREVWTPRFAKAGIDITKITTSTAFRDAAIQTLSHECEAGHAAIEALPRLSIVQAAPQAAS